MSSRHPQVEVVLATEGHPVPSRPLSPANVRAARRRAGGSLQFSERHDSSRRLRDEKRHAVSDRPNSCGLDFRCIFAGSPIRCWGRGISCDRCDRHRWGGRHGYPDSAKGRQHGPDQKDRANRGPKRFAAWRRESPLVGRARRQKPIKLFSKRGSFVKRQPEVLRLKIAGRAATRCLSKNVFSRVAHGPPGSHSRQVSAMGSCPRS